MFSGQQIPQKPKQFQFRNLPNSLDPTGSSPTTQDESSESSNMSEDISLNRTGSLEKMSTSTFEKDHAQRTLSDGFSKAEKRKHLKHPTFFDIAVIRCLYNPNWSEKGVIWALKYLQKRFSEIRDTETMGMNRRATRSLSTPVPIIKVSIDDDDDFREKLCDIPEIVTEMDESPDPNDNTDKLSNDTSSDRKLKSDDSVESDGSSTNKHKTLERQESFECDIDLEAEKSLKWSAVDEDGKNSQTESDTQKTSVHYHHTNTNNLCIDSSISKSLLKDKDVTTSNKSDYLASVSTNDETLDESEESLKSLDGISGVFSNKSGCKINGKTTFGPAYEATGTTFYIEEDGTFNYEVILRALYVLSNRGASQAVIELILPLLETLMGIPQVGLILSRKEKRNRKKKSADESTSNNHGTPTSNASGSSSAKENSREKVNSMVTFC